MKKLLRILFLLQFIDICNLQAQPLSLVITKAQNESMKAKQSDAQKLISQFSFNAYRANYKPQVSFYSNIPVYNKDNFQVVQPDGSIKFLNRSQNNSSLGFSFSQPLAFSGGNISLNTDLSRFDDLNAKYTQYNGTPVFILLNQPLFAFNQYKWDKKIEPLKLEESKRAHTMEMASIAIDITKLYFDILEAQNDIELAKSNLHNADTNYSIEKRRLQLGASTEDKLLQVELQQLQSKQQIEQANYSFQSAQQNLRSYLGTNDNYEPVLPERIKEINITLQEALDLANQHRPEFLSFERKRLEAESNAAKIKADKRQINLTASYGLNKAADNLAGIYQNPNDQQRFSLGVTVPIADWGRQKTRYAVAKTEEKLIGYSNKIDEANDVTEITNLINSFSSLKNNINLAQLTDTIAQKRFVITNRLYQLSKASILDLQVAQNEKDNAKRNYLSAVRTYWEAYYLLKKLTLLD